MYDKLWLIPFFPLLGAVINGLLGKKIKNEKVIGAIATLAVAASFGVSCYYFFNMPGANGGQHYAENIVATWMSVGDLQIEWGFLLDPLSAIMLLVVTGVGSLIHLYSIGYMHGEEGFYRYFSYLNLFVFSMLMLVLGNNALVMFVGWEGVGLCSYLLIGYYFHKKSASDAAKKAFVVNRIGDFGFLIGLFLLYWSLPVGSRSINFMEIAQNAHLLEAGGIVVTVITLCFFLGATGKSAQIPLYTWLPDAMEGPTPVSALIHAATMVTAGVYMIGRLNPLFAMAPDTMMVVAIVGAATAIFAATIGLAQNDIKRVLAYSTVSQLGYMFLAMGVGAFTAGIFHLMTHAFFKACLFLGSGSVIHAMHHALHEAHSHDDPQDMRNMGGLFRKMPITATTFWISTLAIAGFPLLSGFFSKDEILWFAFASPQGSPLLWIVGALAAGLTAFYMFRLVFMTFHGKQKTTEKARKHLHESPWVITVPLVVLALLALVGGWLGVPPLIGEIVGMANSFEHFLEPVFGGTQAVAHGTHALEWSLMGISVGIAFVGIFVAWVMYIKNPELPGKLAGSLQGAYRVIHNKWYVDEIYDATFVDATKRLGTFLWKGFDVVVVDGIVNGFGKTAHASSRALRFLQSGLVHNYALVMVLGVVVIVGFYVLR